MGAVSALATAFPELVAACVREPTDERAAGLAELRATIERFPRHAALKHVLVRRGVPISEDVRAPLRGLTDDEREELDRLLPDLARLNGTKDSPSRFRFRPPNRLTFRLPVGPSG